MDISEGKILHIGCDPVADGYVPLAYGADCFLIKDSLELFRNKVPEFFASMNKDTRAFINQAERLIPEDYQDPFYLSRQNRVFPEYSNDLYEFSKILLKNREDVPEDFLEKNGKKKKILVTYLRIPKFDTYGGDRTAYTFLKLFVSMGLDVTFIPLDFEDEEAYGEHLRKQGIRILNGNFYKKNWIYWLIMNGGKYNYVFMQLTHSKLLSDAVKSYCTNAKIAYCEHDLVFLRKEREYRINKNYRLIKEAGKYKDIVTEIMSKADIVYTLGAYERDILSDMLPGKDIRDLPVYIYNEIRDDIKRNFKDRMNILIVAHVDFEQNLDGILWFKKNVFPKIVERYPDIIWNIVGKVSDINRNKLIDDNIVVHGWMSDDDLKKLYDTCRIAVVPLRFGSGVKGKIIEAAYHGLPVVTTTVGAEGIPLNCGNVFVAEGEDALANMIIELYEDYDKLKKMSMAATIFINENYTSDVAAKTLNDGFIVDR